MVAEVRHMDRRSAPELRGMDAKVIRLEETRAWSRVHHLAGRGHLGVVAGREDIAAISFGEIHSIAARRLRQLGDSNDVA